MGSIGLLLPRPRRRPILLGLAVGAAALGSAAIVLVRGVGWTIEALLFYAFAGLAVVAGGAMISQANPARAALAFAIVVLSTCGLFLLNAAPFLMAGTIIIYAGAIIVTFLFVLMLAQTDGPSDADSRSREPVLAAIAGFFLLSTLLLVLHRSYEPRDFEAWLARVERARSANPLQVWEILGGDEAFRLESEDVLNRLLPRETARAVILIVQQKDDIPGIASPNAENRAAIASWLGRVAEAGHSHRREVQRKFGRLAPPDAARVSEFAGRSPQHPAQPLSSENVASLGRALFHDYLLAVELGGTLLLIATIGAIAIAQRPTARRTP